MKDSVVAFYDDLSDDYHLIFEDWGSAVAWQGEVLDKMIRANRHAPATEIVSLLDCSCGIGTQAIGLAKLGYAVTATDISPASVARARQESAAHGVSIAFGVADFRTLDDDVQGTFDVVLSADNAIPHLLTDDDLQLAFRNMYAKLDPDGLLLITTRDYDALLRNKPSATQPRIFEGGKRLVFQVWDWAEDDRTYRLKQFILRETNGVWETKPYTTEYRALLRDEVNQALKAVGFSDIAWHLPPESGYYQPIVTARKGGD